MFIEIKYGILKFSAIIAWMLMRFGQTIGSLKVLLLKVIIGLQLQKLYEKYL